MKTRDEKLWDACMEIYRRMYREATPSADIDKIIESGEGKKDRFFENYYLADTRQQEIIKEVCKERKIYGHEKRKVQTTVLFGAAPTAFQSLQ